LVLCRAVLYHPQPQPRKDLRMSRANQIYTERAFIDWLQLFYNKRSQFVSGNETEKVEVCVGQRVRLSLAPLRKRLSSANPVNSPSTSASRSLTSPSARSASPTSIPRPLMTTLSSRSLARSPTSRPLIRSSPKLSFSLLRPTATLS
jgi:hypothetical protein